MPSRPSPSLRIRRLISLLRQEAIYLWPGAWALSTFNVGCAPARAEILSDPLSASEPFGLEAYARLADQLDRQALPAALPVLEIGCGKGGGLRYLGRRIARRLIGIDRSYTAILATRLRGLDGRVCSALALPFPDQSIGAVVAVEIIVPFGDADAVLAEAHRTLAPGGALTMVDFRLNTDVATMRSWIAERAAATGFVLKTFEDLSERARAAIIEDEPRRRRFADDLPRPLRSRFQDMLSLEGTDRYRSWVEGRSCYFLAVLSKG